jgi:hypothetical protein
MEPQDFTTSFQVDNFPAEVYTAINNVRGWWSENIEGPTDQLNEEWLYQYKDVHICKMKVVELIPDQKVVWKVQNNYFNFTEDKSEWTGDTIIFEISKQDGKTQLRVTQEGLVPDYECYDICSTAWTSYIQGSLKNLITTGKGNPNTKENDLNGDLLEKWNLPNK